MAVTKITWENKESIQDDGSIARKNKVMDDDMNEIKQVVNNNADELNIAQSNIEDLQSGQSTSNADITSIKNRVSTLETDNKTNKSDISALKSDNTTNKENISTLQEQVENKVDKIPGKGLSTNDFTNEYKQKLEDLENYDDTEVKKDISDIKEEQETQNTNIENLQENDTTQDELIEKLQQENENIKSALINVETEQAKSLHVENTSTVSGELSIEGNAEQDGEPTPTTPVSIKCLGSNKNYFNKDTVAQGKYLTYQNQEVSNSAWTFSDFIECKPNEDWIISGYTAIGGAPGRCFYDKNKNHITGGAHNNQESMMKFTIPDNCYYFRDSIAKADIDTVKIEQNNVATSYSPYRAR